MWGVLMKNMKNAKKGKTVTGFNIGMNNGEDAGQAAQRARCNNQQGNC